MIRLRVRIRFRKQGDLRLISHRDLVRAFERMFRRAGLKLGMSEGYHPKVRMTFPSALALGIQGDDEVMEVELAEVLSANELSEKLVSVLPPGLSIKDIQILEAGQAKARVQRFTYEFPVPEERRREVAAAIDRVIEQPACIVERNGKQPQDVRPSLVGLELIDGTVRLSLHADCQPSARPREVLEMLGLSDLESDGAWLTRTSVELAS